MNVVKVIDSMPGSGKTQYIIEFINKLPRGSKIIYITPFVDETTRIKDCCKTQRFQLPDPSHGRGSKREHFKKLIIEGRNIASTHSLFSGIDDETIKLIKGKKYILILDEVMNVVADLDLYKTGEKDEKKEREMIVAKDMQILLDGDFIRIDDEYKVIWNQGKEALSRYTELKDCIDRGQVYFVKNTYLLLVFPHEIFKGLFKDIYLMTYQFDHQVQSIYFRYFDIPYEKFGVTKTRKDRRCKWEFTFVSYDKYLEYDFAKRKQMKELINICDSERLNIIGTRNKLSKERTELLSKGDYDKKSEAELNDINKKSSSYVRNHLNDKPSTIIWTTFKDHKKSIRGQRLSTKNFVALNARATNDYSEKSGLVYLVNRFPPPYFNHFFRTKNVTIDRDAYALAEMLQWLFRSRIRNDEPIDIFIPSERMRNLLIKWLELEY